MPCYHPVLSWKHKYKKTKNGKSIISYGKPPKTETDRNKKGIYINWEPAWLPCGQCWGCELERTKDWAARIILETKMYQDNYFITLTYDDEHLKRIFYKTENGEIDNIGTLVKKDLQDFNKRLRDHWNYKYNWYTEELGKKKSKIRYYGAGEYGEQGLRPHYHVIYFNFPIFDLKTIGHNHEFDEYWTSEEIAKIWGNGNITIGKVTYRSAAYVARYTMKKWQVERNENQTEEFQIYSTKPAIGIPYYEKNKEQIYKNDEIIVFNKKPVSMKPPKTFDKQFEKTNQENLEKIKQKRLKIATANNQIVLTNTTLDQTHYLSIKEQKDLNRIKNALQRNYEKGEL